MAYIEGEGRNQGTLFPVALDDLVPANHICRVIDAFVELLSMDKLGFQRSQAAETGRPGNDPRTLLKLYLYGYLNQIRSPCLPCSRTCPKRLYLSRPLWTSVRTAF
jgi:transposase